MDKANFITAIALHALILVLGVYDLCMWKTYGLDKTITHVIRDWSHAYPPLPFAMGFLACHLMGG